MDFRRQHRGPFRPHSLPGLLSALRIAGFDSAHLCESGFNLAHLGCERCDRRSYGRVLAPLPPSAHTGALDLVWISHILDARNRNAFLLVRAAADRPGMGAIRLVADSSAG